MGSFTLMVMHTLSAPRMMKDNFIVARTQTEVAKFFGALTPHVNVTRVTNSYPKLLPLSTHSKKAVFRFRNLGYFGRLSAFMCSRRTCGRIVHVLPTIFQHVCHGGWGCFSPINDLSQ